jgi:TonB family protein
MLKPRTSIRQCFLIALILCVSGFGTGAIAQQSATEASFERDRGIDFYKQGRTGEAIRILSEVVKKHSDDADAWYFLGLAYYSDSAISPARVAFEHLLSLRPDSADANAKLAYALILANELERATATARQAIELGDQSAEPHYAIAEASFRAGEYPKAIEEAQKALKLNADFGPALITKSLVHSSLKQYAEAAVNLEKFLAINPGEPDADVWRDQLERLRNFGRQTGSAIGSAGVSKPTEDLALSGREVTTKARVLDKPEPSYTEAARKAGVTGTVVLKCVFSSSGEVKDLAVVRALGYGLTARAVQAAHQIRFTPAFKDGRPVSMWMQLEYNFYLY